ncbi:MAG TPA: substrate-binding domain-containing protein [Candidatus Eisenbacteria bacterium]|nr:substrate-binding domain-containing protein [Candidatus Eisenbacteria bacterium]
MRRALVSITPGRPGIAWRAAVSSASAAAIFATVLATAALGAEFKIIAGGAQSLTPLAEKFSHQFRKRRPDVTVEIVPANSNYAVRAVRAGEIHIGLVTRDLAAEERYGMRLAIIGRDALVFLSYPSNPAANLTREQLRAIYTGEVTNWKDVGGQDQGIVPLIREPGSALQAVFVERLFGREFRGPLKAFVVRADKDKVLRTIKRIRGSLGYGIVRPEEAENEGVRVLAIDGKFPDPKTIDAERYPFARVQAVISKNDAGHAVRAWIEGFAAFAKHNRVAESR